ncbi:PQQ-binding-like beta-propeller repeat protein [Microbacterium oxydans]|uniref:outer membrane protein assembly factor BamB family protein n=1 Tax=Microbacterium oxydans TaxID=82380 RepID=UPI00226B5FBA|nr:PQQ-binding-like beta-propeller repeat protein [Microbacterium oxydans]WAA67524.1 PQQ-binding-like beta-propeller repeat protein [Microbacterium oxydans]
MHGFVTDPDGRPLAGIAVTNGRDVVATDADGGYQLDRVSPFVVVGRTATYTADVWWQQADVEAVDFVLRPHAPALPYEFIHLTDTHMSLPQSEATPHVDFGLYREGSLPSEITAFLASLPERAPSAQSVFITGDLVDHGLAEEFAAYTEVLGTSPLPVHVIPGNHDHMAGRHGSVVSRNDYLTNEGDPALYESFLGPRWYSFDIPGLHVVAMDWHSHELGIDHEMQNSWLAADLALRPPGSPWILLFHDQPGASLLDHAPWQPIATFSGHWHTSRVVDVAGTMHVNSPTTFFASLDYTPPAFRRVTWDGEHLSMRTETVRIVEDPVALGDVSRATFARASGGGDDGVIVWRTPLQGAGHRQQVAVDGDLVFAGSQIEDQPLGFVEALDTATGTVVWRTAVSSAVKTAPVVWADAVVAAEVSGDVHGLDRATGAVRWTVPSSDPLRRFAWNAPTVSDGIVYLGDQSDLRAIDVATGDLVWRRTDLSPHHNLVNHAQPLIIDDLLVMGFWPTPQHPIGIDRLTGESVWETGKADSELFVALKRLLIMGTAVHDPATDAVVMPAFGRTASIDRRSGVVRWTSEHPGAFSPASPVITRAGYLVTVTGHGIRMVDPLTGDTIWEREITGEAPFPMRSYSKRPHPVIAPPTLVDDLLILPGLDGLVRVFDLDGTLLGSAQLGTPLAAAFTVAGDDLIAIGTDGTALRLSVAALLSTVTRTAHDTAESVTA